MAAAFILCAPRTGSTLLRWILDVHPEVACPPEAQVARAVEIVELLVKATSALAVEDEVARRRFVIEETRRLVSAPLEAFAKSKNKRFWCDKTPTTTILLADKVQSVFPAARFFCLYRGCLDLVHSCLEQSAFGFKLTGTAGYVQKTPENLVEAHVRFWCDLTEKELAFEEAHPKLCLRVRYEDVVLAPQTTAPRLFEHLGLEYSKDLLDKIFVAPHTEGMGDNKIHYTRQIEDSTGKGDVLPISRIHAKTRERADALAARLGYPPIGTPPEGSRAPAVRRQVADFFEKELPARLAKRPELAYTMQSCRFVVKDGALTESWHVDLMGAEPKIVASDRKADITFELAPAVMVEIAAKRLNFVVASEDGRLVVHGDRTLASRFYHVMFV